MDQTKTTSSNRTRQQILTAALKLFQNRGFDATTMREIAREAGVSLGASYYYFRSKEELVLAFYQQTAIEAAERHAATMAGTIDFKRRLVGVIEVKLDQLAPYRSLIKVIARQAADLDGPLSPFSAETKVMRDEAISLIARAIDGSNLKVPKLLSPHLPKIFWLYEMLIIFYWANDVSAEQKKTAQLLDQSANVLLRVLQVAALPLITPINRGALKLIELIESCIIREAK